MIHIPLTDGTTLTLKTSWQDVTLAEWTQLLEDRSRLLSIAAGLTPDQYAELPDEIRSIINSTIAFLDEEIPLVGDWPEIDVAEQTIGQLEDCKALIGAKGLFGAMPFLYAIYRYPEMEKAEQIAAAERIAQEPAMYSYGFILQVIESLEAFNQKYAILGSIEPKPEQIDAGIDRLTRFGFLVTLRALSGGDISRHEEILKMEADYVYMNLVVAMEEAQYEERLQEIYRLQATLKQ